MSTNPFLIEVVVSGQGRKLFEQLDGLTSQEAQELLEGGYFTVLREAKKAGRLPSPTLFRSFLSGDCKLVRTNLILDCSKLFDSVSSLGENWKELERDERAYALMSVDFSKCQFLTCLKEGQEYIKGEDNLRLFKEDHPQLIRHGGNQFLTLWEDYQKTGATSVLEHLRLTQGITYMNFPGLILQDPYGDRRLLFLWWFDRQWSWRSYLLSDRWSGGFPSALSPAS